MNQPMPLALAVKSAPRSAAKPINTTTCNAVTTRATDMLPNTTSIRGIGAVSSSRRAPLSRSTITPIPENIVLSGTSRPTVAMATKDM